LPFVSRFCSTTRASLFAAAKPTLHRTGVFYPGLKFSLTLGSGRTRTLPCPDKEILQGEQ
jgi:hypothetical protein